MILRKYSDVFGLKYIISFYPTEEFFVRSKSFAVPIATLLILLLLMRYYNE